MYRMEEDPTCCSDRARHRLHPARQLRSSHEIRALRIEVQHVRQSDWHLDVTWPAPVPSLSFPAKVALQQVLCVILHRLPFEPD